jgi:hypothetical protein
MNVNIDGLEMASTGGIVGPNMSGSPMAAQEIIIVELLHLVPGNGAQLYNNCVNIAPFI